MSIEMIKSHVSVFDVAMEYTEARLTAGNRGKGRCPLHDDPNPSFTLYLDSNTWWCFGCGRGGDVIDLVRAARRCSFHHAVSWICKTYNLPVPQFKITNLNETSPPFDVTRAKNFHRRELVNLYFCWCELLNNALIKLLDSARRELQGQDPLARDAALYTRIAVLEDTLERVWRWRWEQIFNLEKYWDGRTNKYHSRYVRGTSIRWKFTY